MYIHVHNINIYDYIGRRVGKTENNHICIYIYTYMYICLIQFMEYTCANLRR